MVVVEVCIVLYFVWLEQKSLVFSNKSIQFWGYWKIPRLHYYHSSFLSLIWRKLFRMTSLVVGISARYTRNLGRC